MSTMNFNLVIRMNPIESSQYELIRINPNLQSEGIRSIRMIPKNWPNSDWSNLFGLIRIDRVYSDWFWMNLGLIRIEKFLGLDRNETVWFGYKFLNDSENFWLVWNEFQSETFARVIYYHPFSGHLPKIFYTFQ